MPRPPRSIEAGLVYHVLNRGNGRMRLFLKDADFEAFERVLAEGLERYLVDLLTYCLMGNHWHLVVRPREDDALGRRDARPAAPRTLPHARRHRGTLLKLATWPVDRPRNWLAAVNEPLGKDAWGRRAAARLGPDSTLRSPGRPRRNRDEQ